MRAFHLLLAGVFVVGMTACATDRDRTCAEGAAVGGVGGAALGQAVGGNTSATLIGAAIGTVAGAAFGCKVADDKAAYAKREAELKTLAERAIAVANANKAEAERLSRQVAQLNHAVENLRIARMDAQARQVAASVQQRQFVALQQDVDRRLLAVREEIGKQTAAFQAAEAEAKRVASLPSAQPALPKSEGLVLVSAGIRDLEQQSRALELVKAQLRQIDRRRAY